jgi:nucleoside recognition membrane protein YjiH
MGNKLIGGWSACSKFYRRQKTGKGTVRFFCSYFRGERFFSDQISYLHLQFFSIVNQKSVFTISIHSVRQQNRS